MIRPLPLYIKLTSIGLLIFSEVRSSGEALKLRIEGNGYSDETIIRFISGATSGFDGSYDAWKLFSPNASAPELFTRSSESYELSINSWPDLTASFSSGIYLDIPSAGTYTLTPSEPVAFAATVCIRLKDLTTGLTYDLRSSTSYVFTLPVILPTAAPRWQIQFSMPAAISTQAASSSAGSDGAIGINKQGETNWSYNVLNAAAVSIASGTSSTSSVTVTGITPGAYTVQITSAYSCTESRSVSVGPFIYYSRANGNWSDPATWSLTACGGAAATSSPGPNDQANICSPHAVTINSSAILGSINVNGGSLTAATSFTVTGNFNLSSGSFAHGLQTVTLAGNRQQIIGGLAITFNNLYVKNTFPAEGILLQAPVNVGGTLTLDDGHITTTSTNKLTLTSNSLLVLAGAPQDSSFVKGPMSHVIATSTGLTKIFPVGEGNSYRRMDLTMDQRNSTSTTYTVELENLSAQSLGYTLPMSVSNVSYVRYHVLSQSPATRIDNAQVRIYFGCSGLDDRVEVLPGISVVQDNGAGAWVDLGDTPNGFICSGTSNWGSALSGVFDKMDGNKYALANTGSPSPMPVELKDLAAEHMGENVSVTWKTASETGNDFFTVEKSTDPVSENSWIAVGKVAGAGNSATLLNYGWLDARAMSDGNGKVVYYRVRQTDYNGVSRVSQSVSVALHQILADFAYPNPATTEFYLPVTASGDYEVSVHDLSGKEIFRTILSAAENQNRLKIELERKFHSGLYVVHCGSGTSKKIYRLIIQ